MKEGLSQKGQGLGELIGRDTREELPLPQEKKSEAAPLWAPREGDNLERGRGFLFSCHSCPREAAWRDKGGRRDVSSQALESETAKGETLFLVKNSPPPSKRRKERSGSPTRAFKAPAFLCSFTSSDFKMNYVTKSNARTGTLSVLVAQQWR